MNLLHNEFLREPLKGLYGVIKVAVDGPGSHFNFQLTALFIYTANSFQIALIFCLIEFNLFCFTL